MKKRPFVLLEVLLAIAILALAFVPLAGSPFLMFKKQRDELITLELEREAEVIFYNLLKNFRRYHPDWGFETKHSKSFEWKEPVTIDVQGLGRATYKVHYHLSHRRDKKSHLLYKLWCNICFEVPKKDCKVSRQKGKQPHTFNFVVKRIPKKVDQNSDAMHSEEKSQK